MAGALEGIRVVELGHWVAVPSACALLADGGAEGIKVEEPGVGDAMRGMTAIEGVAVGPVHFWFEQINRNKKSVAVDLRRERGREVVHRLVRTADVFASNFRLSVLKRFGMDYHTLSQLNPRLVYTVLTGFGKLGPDREKPGYDYSAFWARGGLMDRLGPPGAPPAPQRPGLGDNITSMLMAGTISTALYARERTGLGQELDLSLFNTAVWALSIDIVTALVSGMEIPKTDRRTVRNPLWNTYQTRDGRWLQLIMLQTDRFWPGFCQATGCQHLEKDPRFESHQKREENSQALIAILEPVFASQTLAEWEAVMSRYDLIFGRVQGVKEVLSDPQALENGFFAEVDHPAAGRTRLIGSPVKFSQTPASVRVAAPQVGQHTEEVLLGLDYTWEDLGELKRAQAIP